MNSCILMNQIINELKDIVDAHRKLTKFAFWDQHIHPFFSKCYFFTFWTIVRILTRKFRKIKIACFAVVFMKEEKKRIFMN